MKVTTEFHSPTIVLEQIDPKVHVIVAKLGNYLCIGHHQWGTKDKFKFHLLNDKFTLGNTFIGSGGHKAVIKDVLARGGEVHAFLDYRSALQWLLNQSVEDPRGAF